MAAICGCCSLYLTVLVWIHRQPGSSSGGVSCAEPGGPSGRSSGCRPRTWRVWRRCASGSAGWARPIGQSASRSSPTCSGTVSHLEVKTGQHVVISTLQDASTSWLYLVQTSDRPANKPKLISIADLSHRPACCKNPTQRVRKKKHASGFESYLMVLLHQFPFAVAHCTKWVTPTSPGFIWLTELLSTAGLWMASKKNNQISEDHIKMLLKYF